MGDTVDNTNAGMTIDWASLEEAAKQQEQPQPEEQDTQPAQPQGNVPPGIDPEVYELAIALKKLREDPRVAQLATQLQNQNAPQFGVPGVAQPGFMQPGAPQPAEPDPETKRLQEVEAELAKLRQEYMTLAPDSEEAQRIALRLGELQNEKLLLEPKVMLKKQLQPIQQAQVTLQVNTLLQQVANRLNTDPRLAQLGQEQKTYVYNVVQNALQQLAAQSPQQLLSPVATSLVEAAMRSAVYEVLLPANPYDPGHNSQQKVDPLSQLPKEIVEAAKEDGIPLDKLVQNLKEELNAG